jgi:hypothetical protein
MSRQRRRLFTLHSLKEKAVFGLPFQCHDAMYSPSALEALINACPELESLGLSLANIDLST